MTHKKSTAHLPKNGRALNRKPEPPPPREPPRESEFRFNYDANMGFMRYWGQLMVKPYVRPAYVRPAGFEPA